MTTFLVIAAIVVAVYIYAAIAYYLGFKNWYPLCGCVPAPGRKQCT